MGSIVALVTMPRSQVVADGASTAASSEFSFALQSVANTEFSLADEVKRQSDADGPGRASKRAKHNCAEEVICRNCPDLCAKGFRRCWCHKRPYDCIFKQCHKSKDEADMEAFQGGVR